MMRPRLYLLPFFLLISCTNTDSIQTECSRGIGEACNKMGKESSGAEALSYFRKACDLGNTNGCVNLAEMTGDKNEALRVLRFSCDKGNTRACAKFAELAVGKP